jgi:hypothetical protein
LIVYILFRRSKIYQFMIDYTATRLVFRRSLAAREVGRVVVVVPCFTSFNFLTNIPSTGKYLLDFGFRVSGFGFRVSVVRRKELIYLIIFWFVILSCPHSLVAMSMFGIKWMAVVGDTVTTQEMNLFSQIVLVYFLIILFFYFYPYAANKFNYFWLILQQDMSQPHDGFNVLPSTIIMDNVNFHLSEELRTYIEDELGRRLVFLPTYSYVNISKHQRAA